MNMAHESKSNKTPLYLIGELIGVPNTVMDSALHELRDRIDKDPKYKDITLMGVANECGFNSKTSFYRVFKEVTTYRVFVLIYIVLF